MDALRDLYRSRPQSHEELKKRIHNFRMPLSKRGIFVAKCVYLTVPVVSGYFIMEWSQERARENLGLTGEHMRSTNHDKIMARQQNKMFEDFLGDADRRKGGDGPAILGGKGKGSGRGTSLPAGDGAQTSGALRGVGVGGGGGGGDDDESAMVGPMMGPAGPPTS